jgi:hypothetical protein
MAHFAQLDEYNVVINVIVVANNDCVDDNGTEQESIGVGYCERLLGGRWVQTSYNGNIRKRFAGIGYYYDETADVFIAPKPSDDATLNEDYDWVLPYDADEEHLRKLLG